MREYRDQALEQERLLFEAHKKAVSVIDNDRIKMTDFYDTYSRTAVEADMAEVSRLKRVFKEEETPDTRRQKRQADILEAMLLEQIEQNQWFGKEVTTRAASEFDDFINGTDMIALIDVDQRATVVTGFGIDVTFSKHTEKKLQRIRREITQGKLPTIRYAEERKDEQETPNFQGTLHNQPRVILAMSDENLMRTAHTWVHGKGNALANHPMKVQFAQQIHTQLQIYREYARSIGKTDVANTYDRQFRIWEDLLAKQNYFDGLDETPEARTFFENDPTHTALMQAAHKMLP